VRRDFGKYPEWIKQVDDELGVLCAKTNRRKPMTAKEHFPEVAWWTFWQRGHSPILAAREVWIGK